MAVTDETHVVPDVGAAFGDVVQEEFASRPRADDFVLALGGGSTAKVCYAALLETNVDWPKVTVIWGDERMVPPDHQDSNYRLAKEVFLDKVGESNFKAVHRMDAAHGAEAYEETIRNLMPIDVAHLGMGEDGHTLSLFPGSPALHAPANRLVVATGDELHPHPRMTLTYAATKQMRVGLFTIIGAGKFAMFKRIQAQEDLPAVHVECQRVAWIADPPAVGQP